MAARLYGNGNKLRDLMRKTVSVWSAYQTAPCIAPGSGGQRKAPRRGSRRGQGHHLWVRSLAAPNLARMWQSNINSVILYRHPSLSCQLWSIGNDEALPGV